MAHGDAGVVVATTVADPPVVLVEYIIRYWDFRHYLRGPYESCLRLRQVRRLSQHYNTCLFMNEKGYWQDCHGFWAIRRSITEPAQLVLMLGDFHCCGGLPWDLTLISTNGMQASIDDMWIGQNFRCVHPPNNPVTMTVHGIQRLAPPPPPPPPPIPFMLQVNSTVDSTAAAPASNSDEGVAQDSEDHQYEWVD